jgi:hypothetical protein
MSGERQVSQQTALAEVDRELKAALSISPSTDFEARVLGRVAERDVLRTRRWMAYAPLAAAAVLVLAATVAGVMMRSDGRGTIGQQAQADIALPPRGPAPQAAHQPLADPGRQEATSAVGSSTRSVPSLPQPAPSFPAARAAEPEVIVPAEHAEAVRRLVRGIAEGRIRPPAASDQQAGAVPAPVPVQPLIVEPILVSGAEQRGGPTPVVRPQ